MTANRHFRTEPSTYERVLHAWVSLTSGTCGGGIQPNRLGKHGKAGMLLEHRVAPRAAPHPL